MLRNTSNVIPGTRIGENEYRQTSTVNNHAIPGTRIGGNHHHQTTSRVNNHVIPTSGSRERQTTSRVNNHVIPGIDRQQTNYFTPLQMPLPEPYSYRRFDHVQTSSRSFGTNGRFGIREAAYIPFLGTIIGIGNFVFGILCILNLTHLRPSLGYRYCGRGLVEMIPFVGGISLYFYDRR